MTNFNKLASNLEAIMVRLAGHVPTEAEVLRNLQDFRGRMQFGKLKQALHAVLEVTPGSGWTMSLEPDRGPETDVWATVEMSAQNSDDELAKKAAKLIEEIEADFTRVH